MSDQELKVFKELLSFTERETCLHDETYRGGTIWEICSSCGRKWADDEGGKPDDAHEYPSAIVNAQKLLFNQVKLTEKNCSVEVPIGQRGPIENHIGLVTLIVHAQQEPDGTWAAMVPNLTHKCQSAATREEAIRLACEVVSQNEQSIKL
jgi:hypothetical protein